MDFGRHDVRPAMRAAKAHVERVVAGSVNQSKFWRGIDFVEPTFAPLPKGHEDRIHVATSLGQAVLVPCGARGVAPAFENLLTDQMLQTLSQNTARDAEVLLEIVESPNAKKGFLKHGEGPGIAKDVEHSCDGDGAMQCGGLGHLWWLSKTDWSKST